MSSESPQYQVRALERALDLLDAFSLAEPELSFTDLTERSGLSKGTAVRLLAVLERRGLLERSPDTDRYRIGLRAFELGSVYIQSLPLESVVATLPENAGGDLRAIRQSRHPRPG